MGSVRSRQKRDVTHTAAPANLSTLEVLLRRLPRAKPGFVEPMKALLVAKLPKGPEWVYEVKFDGFRALAIKDGQKVSLLSRNAKDFTERYSTVAQALRALPAKSAVLDGEIVAVDAEMKTCHWLEPKLICQVRFTEWTRDHHLRQPVFQGIREDKEACEVVRERPSALAGRRPED